ncbi:MAG: PadR family transcriptional regulator [Chloroflexota bacterium]
MSLKHAILGFLSFKPLSGYDLKKAFDRSVRHFWPANQSQIYRTLAELEKESSVEKEVVSREERLDMKVYSITESGREELRRWLATPLPPQDYREPFLIQIYFGGKLSDSEMIGLLQGEIRDIEERLALYVSIYRMNVEKMKDADDRRSLFLSISTLEYGIYSNQTALEWLKSVAERLSSGNFALADFQPR